MLRSLGVLVLIAVVASLTACDTASGGGWIISAGDPTKKATFGLTMSCSDVPGGVIWQGTVEYHDQFKTWPDTHGRLRPLGFNGTLNWNDILNNGMPIAGTCAGYDILGQATIFAALGWSSGVSYIGQYTPQPTTLGPGGSFAINVQDNGKTGPDKGDTLSVSVSDGLYAGYFNSGVLQGGQITTSIP